VCILHAKEPESQNSHRAPAQLVAVNPSSVARSMFRQSGASGFYFGFDEGRKSLSIGER
jgi:hypothetical protein